MNKSLEQVSEFHKVFEHPVNTHVGQESLHIRRLRIKLLFEELKELAEASDCKMSFRDLCVGVEADQEWLTVEDGDNVSKLEELDALCDIQYVLNGKILTAGLQYVFDPAFAVVHHNNMSKAHRSLEHAVETTTKVLELAGQIMTTKVIDDTHVILMRGDGKVIKPWDHKKVSLEEFVAP